MDSVLAAPVEAGQYHPRPLMSSLKLYLVFSFSPPPLSLR